MLVERDRLGGTGFRWGCLPVKMMLDKVRTGAMEGGMVKGCVGSPAAVITDAARRIREVETGIRGRLSAAGVEVARGEGRFQDPRTVRLGGRTVSAQNIVIATGTEPAGWPGVALNGEAVISHREVLGWTEVPERLLILGGDVEGIEFACLFARLGCKVTVIEKERRILPGTDPDLSTPVETDLRDRGVELITGKEVRECVAGGSPVVTLGDGSKVEGERILVTGVRRPSFPDGLERAGVERDRGKIRVNGDLQTSCESIYALGDINGITGMAHAAIQQGLYAARRIAGQGQGAGASPAAPPYPRAVYTIPEIAGAGYQENELVALGIPYRQSVQRLGDTWRGISKGIERGFLKVLAGQDERILGLWVCGADASELASLFGPLLAGGLTADGLRDGLILHPTLGEAALEAVLKFSQ
jgi:dihydrolipoamide dehydrogenase